MGLQEVLTSLSNDLTKNEALLSGGERELLAAILRQSRQCGNGSRELAMAVEGLLARAVGEVVLQRAGASVGSVLLEEIGQRSLRDGGLPEATRIFAGPQPPPSPTGPRPPGPHLAEAARGFAGPQPPPSPTGPRPPAPGPRLGAHGTLDARPEVEVRAAVATEEAPRRLRAECVVFDEFLAPHELEELVGYSLSREHEFRTSEVIAAGISGVIDPDYRRSRVLMELGKHGDVLTQRIEVALPRVFEKLGLQPFPATRIERQITASNHGDFFRHHSDNAEAEIATRQLTFVYFFHREPKVFEGGELRLHDAFEQNGTYAATGECKVIVPAQNQIVFFRSSLLHEITPVICPSQAFADSRFTVNGWLHR